MVDTSTATHRPSVSQPLASLPARRCLPGALMIAGALTIVGALVPRVAAAQGFANFNGAPTGPVVGSADDKRTPRQAAPPALPGSHTEKTTAAPALAGTGDLPPTEALFDAINRGDTLAARDAVNRGADPGGRNVLGLTPLDLSVDLGRNDITFLLLSLRPASPRDSGPATTASRTDPRRGAKGAAAASAGTNAAGANAAGGTASAVNPTTRRSVQPRQVAERPARVAPTAPQPPQPRQYAGQRDDAGTPSPQAGFLGFGGVTR